MKTRSELAWWAEAFINRGAALYHKGDYDLATKDSNAAMRLAPNEGEFYLNRGEAYLAKKAYQEPVDDLTQAVRLYSNPAKSMTPIGYGRLPTNRKGIEMPQRPIAVGPSD